MRVRAWSSELSFCWNISCIVSDLPAKLYNIGRVRALDGATSSTPAMRTGVVLLVHCSDFLYPVLSF